MKRHRSLFLTVILTLFVVLHLVADDDDKYFTHELTNGRAWRTFSVNEKAMYIAGFREAVLITTTALFPQAKQLPLELNSDGFSGREILKQIDAFYTDSFNVRIPIPYAFTCIVKKQKGAEPIELETTWPFSGSSSTINCRRLPYKGSGSVQRCWQVQAALQR